MIKNITLQKNNFYDDFNRSLFITGNFEKIGYESVENKTTLRLSDSDKDKVTLNDLSEYVKIILDKRKLEINQNIKYKVIFRIWHDVTSDWLRYTFISMNDAEIKAKHAKTEDLEFVIRIEEVLESFLNERSSGRYKTNKFGIKEFHNNSPYDEFEPWKIYEEEIIPTQLQVIK